MIFHSIDFIIFFIVVISLYWQLPRREQTLFLLLSSYFFYGYVHPWFLLLILTSTVVDYVCGRSIAAGVGHRKAWLVLSLATNLGLLGVFKYFNFFVENISLLLTGLGFSGLETTLQVVLPVGISFYTFQTISYTVDVYRGKLQACKNPMDFAVYVSFFPQLVAGPIERATHLLPQIQKPRRIDRTDIYEGLLLILWGFFKKLVIADNVAEVANQVFYLKEPSFFILWAGVFAFAVQILADFSAYTDIARGVARLLGITLCQNFNHPYFAVSPADFWRRWHMSLSYWIRDYLYIPLGGSHGAWFMAARNLLITFVLCGLWHGASWNFILWGAYHGLLILTFRGLTNLAYPHWVHAGWFRPVRVLFMFVLTCIGWLIFRETNLELLVRDLLLSPWHSSSADLLLAMFLFSKALLFGLPLWLHGFYDQWQLGAWLKQRPARFILGSQLFAISAFVLILVARSKVPADFIYFQF
ncbi:MBOAT family O-acyltransferase [Magnetococcus sp. PR-3]|uniref:MBOAT family O-acyltransferase n=1 Tax=Magnetococcus sp. PR-3 TaxID=3120355 RepID=UPI002FCE62BA